MLTLRVHTLMYGVHTYNRVYVYATEVCIDDGSINIGVLCNQPPIWCHCADSSVGSFLILFSWPACQSLLFLMYCTRSDARGYVTPSAQWSVYLGRFGTRYLRVTRYRLPTCRYVKSTGNERRTMENRTSFSFAILIVSFCNWFRNEVASKWIYAFFNCFIYS